jgi:hypothetical protein
MPWFGWIVYLLGALVCVANAYPSFLRYPLHRLRGGSRETFHWISAVPLFGSLLVAAAWASWLRGEGSHALDWTTAFLVLIDTGGIHWFALAMLGEWVSRRRGES